MFRLYLITVFILFLGWVVWYYTKPKNKTSVQKVKEAETLIKKAKRIYDTIDDETKREIDDLIKEIEQRKKMSERIRNKMDEIKKLDE